MGFRFAAPADSAALLAIYGQYLDTPTTFECVLPSEEEFAGRITAFGGTYPYLVWEEDGRIRGYAYAHRQAERAAYQWNAELSVYLDRDCTGRGVGRRLYSALVDILRLQGIRTVYGCVTLPNEKSEGLHRTMGFHKLGTYHSAGYKCGAWHDVAWFERPIAPYDQDPAPIRSIGEIPAETLAEILRRYEAGKEKTRGAIWLRVFVFWWIREISPCRRGRSSPWCRGSCPTGCR